MAGLQPNSSNISRVSRTVASSTHVVVHPEYEYWKPEWRKIRDVLAGQREIKRKGRVYLPGMKGADDDDYKIYLERATFYNMTAQTLSGMLGQVFRREPTIKGLPAKYKDTVKKFAKDGTGIAGFTKTAMGEQIGLGRFGVLVDAPAIPVKGFLQSYAVGYAAENIIDWTVEDVDGTIQPTRVLLREFARDDSKVIAPKPISQAEARKAQRAGRNAAVPTPLRKNDGMTYVTYYRELVLERDVDGVLVYAQYTYKDDPCGTPESRVVPVIRGKALNFIPFKFFGATSNASDAEKPPLLDIVDLNLSHYRTYAELEYGRLFTALPVYYAPGTDADGASEYHLGPNRVWEVPQGSEPGILEYKGQGLKALETALDDKERQIAAIGGRMMPGSSKSVSESNNQTTLREANEQSLLLNVIQACETGMREVVRWWLMWREEPLSSTEGLRFEINQDFLSTPIGAREIRAIQLLYKDGVITIDILYNYLKKAEIIPSETTMEEFKVELQDPDSFLNNPDAQARQRGFSDRKQELEQVRVAREADFTQQEIDLQERSVEVDEDALEIAAEVGATSVSGSRKLGDPEQAKPAREIPQPKVVAPVGAQPRRPARPGPTS